MKAEEMRELRDENTRLKESVKRLSYLALEKGYGVWRCVKCDIRYTTLPGADAVCGNSIFTERGSVQCHGKLEPFAPEAAEPTASALTLAQQEARAERDREWRDAVKALSDDCSTDCLLPHEDCDDAAPLRALLEGK